MIDLAKLRTLLAAASESMPVSARQRCSDSGQWAFPWRLDVGQDGCGGTGVMREAPARLIVAAVSALPGLLDELEAWRNATYSPTPADLSASVAQHAIDYAEARSALDKAISDGDDLRAELRDRVQEFERELEVLRPLPRILDSYRSLAEKDRDQLTAWRTATGCATPEEVTSVAETMDAVARYAAANGIVIGRLREGTLQRELAEMDALLAERERWKAATGCDTPDEAGEEMALTQHGHDQWYDEVKQWRATTGCDSPEDLHASVASADAQMAELARLRELESAADEWWHADLSVPATRHRVRDRLAAAIAACRAAKEGT